MAVRRKCDCGGTADKPNPECERCRLVHFFVSTVRMRRLQKTNQRAIRPGTTLEAAQNAERYVDKLIERLEELQPELFNTEEKGA